jgi:hypothetical protein
VGLKDGVGRIREGERTVSIAQTNTQQKEVDAQACRRAKRLAGSTVGAGKAGEGRHHLGRLKLVRTKSKCRQRLLACM